MQLKITRLLITVSITLQLILVAFFAGNLKLCHPMIRATEESIDEEADEEVLLTNTNSSSQFVVKKEDFLRHLHEITGKLIDMRSTVDEKFAGFIDKKYDYFQKLLLSIEGEKQNQKFGTAMRSNKTYVCAEEYKGSTYGYPFFRKGFQKRNCSRILPREFLTIILDNPCHKHQQLNCSTEQLLQSMRKRYGLIAVHVIDNTNSPAKALNEITRNVKTPFVYIAPYLAKFDDDIDIDRLIDVLVTVGNNVAAVGGSVKDLATGEWTNGCLQIELVEYTLYYDDYYRESIRSCLKCDVLTGGFAVRTDFLKSKRFNEAIKRGYYEDWFMRINTRNLDRWMKGVDRLKGVALSCPDVMSRMIIPHVQDSELLGFVDRWSIKRIIDRKGAVHWFGCKRNVKHKRTGQCGIGGGMSVPPCCLENLADAVKFIMTTCEKHGIVCELQEGTLLGSVKMNNVLHWEKDADLTFLTADFDKFKDLKNVFSAQGYSLSVKAQPWCCVDGIKAGGVFNVGADSWQIEIYGQHKMDTNENKLIGEQPTRIEFAGQMVQVPNNPGQYSRNRYGHEIYKHAEHWFSNNVNSGWALYHPGTFHKCAMRGHHGCLDQFKADGNIQFKRLRINQMRRKRTSHKSI
eukprot:gene17017-18731_t